jgi:hypothetical protein
VRGDVSATNLHETPAKTGAESSLAIPSQATAIGLSDIDLILIVVFYRQESHHGMLFFFCIPTWFVANVLLGHAGASRLRATQDVISATVTQQGTSIIDHGANPSSQHIREARFGFNIKRYDYYTHLIIEEKLDGPYERNNTEGMIAFVKGDVKQLHNFEVLVKARSTSEEPLDCLEFVTDEYSLSILTSSTEGMETCSLGKVKLQLDIIIAVRPNSVQSGGGEGTRIATKFLSVVIWPEVVFDASRMALHSIYGDVVCHETFYFTARSITVSSDHGMITGNWSLATSIAFATIDGKIDLDLPPKRWNAGTSTRGSMSAQSFSGNINIRMPFEEDKISLRNSTSNIVTQYGSVEVSLVHGAVTDIRAGFGSINATLLLHWAFDLWEGVQHNYITTNCTRCNTTLNVLTPIVDDYYKIRPLYFTKSKHQAAVEDISLYYPWEWAGTAEWVIEVGTANISGEDYEIVDDDGSRGKIQRLPLGSNMYAGVGTGNLSLVMKAR